MNIMLDLETFGGGRDAAIRSIGSCLFDPVTGYLGDAAVPARFSGTFHWGVDLAASRSPGAIDPRTVEWWLEQSDAARLALIRLRKEPLEKVLSRWTVWVRDLGDRPLLWSNGPLFDERILRETFERHGMPFPIHYRESRCFRTIVGLAREKGLVWKHHDEEGASVKHDALNDCFRQAEAVIEAYRILGIEK
jgi:hypothetical protein